MISMLTETYQVNNPIAAEAFLTLARAIDAHERTPHPPVTGVVYGGDNVTTPIRVCPCDALTATRADCDSLKARFAEARNDLAAMTHNRDKAVASVCNWKTLTDELVNERDSLKAQLAEAKTATLGYYACDVGKCKVLNNERVEANSLKAQLAAAQEVAECDHDIIVKLEAQLSEANSTIEQLRAEVKASERTISNLKLEEIEHQAERDRLRGKNARLESQLAEAQARAKTDAEEELIGICLEHGGYSLEAFNRAREAIRAEREKGSGHAVPNL